MDNVRADESVVQEKIQALRKLLSRNAQLLIAYSGGVDSTFLLAEATGTLGKRALGIIADSPQVLLLEGIRLSSIGDLLLGVVGLIVGQIRVFELFSPHLRPGEGNFWLQSSICVHFTRILTAAGAEGTPLVKGL